MTTWVVDTSPLIFLAKLGHLGFLRRSRVVMDDLDARRFARRVGLDLIGTMGLLLAARLRGEMPSIREEVERLQALGFRVAPPLVEAILREAGE